MEGEDVRRERTYGYFRNSCVANVDAKHREAEQTRAHVTSGAKSRRCALHCSAHGYDAESRPTLLAKSEHLFLPAGVLDMPEIGVSMRPGLKIEFVLWKEEGEEKLC